MTVPTGVESGQGTSEGTAPEPTGTGQSGVNPAWNDVLGIIPQNLHGQITPHLQKWDEGVQKKFSEIHSRYQPYADFETQGVTPDMLNVALNVARAIQDDPRGVYDALQSEYGYGQEGQGQGGLPNQQQPVEEDWGDLPPQVVDRLSKMQEEFNSVREVAGALAQIALGQNQESQAAQEDREVEELYQTLMSQDEDFRRLNAEGKAEPYINALLMADVAPEDALKQFHEFRQLVLKDGARAPAPKLLGPGGAIPGTGLDVKTAPSKDVRELVANMFGQAQSEG